MFSLLAGQPCDQGDICSAGGSLLTSSISRTPPGPEELEEPSTPDPPGNPTGLTGSVNASGHIVLSWNAPEGSTVTGYQVLRRRPHMGETRLEVYVDNTAARPPPGRIPTSRKGSSTPTGSRPGTPAGSADGSTAWRSPRSDRNPTNRRGALAHPPIRALSPASCTTGSLNWTASPAHHRNNRSIVHVGKVREAIVIPIAMTTCCQRQLQFLPIMCYKL